MTEDRVVSQVRLKFNTTDGKVQLPMGATELDIIRLDYAADLKDVSRHRSLYVDVPALWP